MENMGFKPKAVVRINLEEIQALRYGPDTCKKMG